MMVLNRVLHLLAFGQRRQDFSTNPGMPFQEVELILGQRTRFVQDSLRDKNLADIVNPCGESQIPDFFGRQAQ